MSVPISDEDLKYWTDWAWNKTPLGDNHRGPLPPTLRSIILRLEAAERERNEARAGRRPKAEAVAQ